MILLIVSAFYFRRIAEADECDALQWRKKKEKDPMFFFPTVGHLRLNYTMRAVSESERIFCLYDSLLDVLPRRHPG